MVHARALRQANPDLTLIGVDADAFRINRALTDKNYLVPRSSNPEFIPVLNQVIECTGADLLLTNVTADIPTISGNRDRLNCRVFLPDHETVMLCEDKAASNEVWEKNGVPVPRSMSINSEDDLKTALAELGPDIWLRAIQGSGASGALPVSDIKTGVKWIDLNDGWGNFMAAERLGAVTTSWESIWSDGELIAAQGRKRLFWEFGRIAMSGVSGIAGAGETVSDPEVDEIALKAIRAVANRPHGVLGVDMAYDRHGVPKVTEINPGRFMSGGVCHYASVDVNFPGIEIEVALSGSVPSGSPRINPMQPGRIFVSGLDNQPIFTTHSEVAALREGLAEMSEG